MSAEMSPAQAERQKRRGDRGRYAETGYAYPGADVIAPAERQTTAGAIHPGDHVYIDNHHAIVVGLDPIGPLGVGITHRYPDSHELFMWVAERTLPLRLISSGTNTGLECGRCHTPVTTVDAGRFAGPNGSTQCQGWHRHTGTLAEQAAA